MTLDARGDTSGKTCTLYVVLHGEIAIYEDKDGKCLRLFAPAMADHTYMAGPWLGEKHIPSGCTLELRGTHPTEKTQSIHNDSDMILLNNAVPNPVGSWFEIRLPQPKQIHPGRLVSFPGIEPKGDAENSPQKADVNPVFEYCAEEGAYLQLLSQTGMSCIDTSGPIWAAKEGKPGFWSLHIYAENDLPVSADHTPSSFNMAAGILGSSAALRTTTMPDPKTKYCEVKGLHISELMLNLQERIEATARMGAEMRNQDHPKPTLLWDPKADDPLGTPHGSCGPLGG